jgi:hypothetical protein
MTIRERVQSVLDTALLGPYKIHSHHMKRVESVGAAVNQDEYVVYRVVSSPNHAYGNGAALTERISVDVSYFYRYGKAAAKTRAAEARMKLIEQAFVAAGWTVLNGQNDAYEDTGDFRGINIEVAFYRVKYGE